MIMKMTYDVEKDVRFICELSGDDLDSLSKKMSLSRRTLQYAFKSEPSADVLEKIYSYIYRNGSRLSVAKSDLFQESLKPDEKLFFHGSRFGFEQIDPSGSRNNSDLSYGFYCSGNLRSAVSFVEEYRNSSVYVFKANLSGLKSEVLSCDLDWMLAISYYRDKLGVYSESEYIQNLIRHLDSMDFVVAPIADNKMFEILNQFANGDITTVQAIHSLSASRLGNQFVFKSPAAVERLVFIDRFYLCDEERKNSLLASGDHSNVIQTKLDMAKRQFRNKGKYIDELFI